MFLAQYFDTLFISANLILAYTFIGGYSLRKYSTEDMKKIKIRIWIGISSGLLNVLVLAYDYTVSNTSAVLDFRIITLITSFYLGGLLSSSITGFFTIAFRFLYFGVTRSAYIDAYGMICILVFLVFISLIDKYKPINKTVQWILCIAFALFSNLMVYNIVLTNLVINPWPVITQYTMCLTLAAATQFFLIKYVESSNAIYLKYLSTANIDHLTNLHNTRYFDGAYNEAVQNALNQDIPFSCIMIDIDFFKRVNDEHGHAAGDIVLQMLGELLKESFRKEDIVGRIGGEEFCVVMNNCSLARAQESAEKFRNLVCMTPFSLSEAKSIYITVSLGVASYRESTQNSFKVKELADDALYNAKRSGRNKVCVI